VLGPSCSLAHAFTPAAKYSTVQYSTVQCIAIGYNPLQVLLPPCGVVQLFHFDVHEDVRTSADARIEKDEVRPCSSPLIRLPHRLTLLDILKISGKPTLLTTDSPESAERPGASLGCSACTYLLSHCGRLMHDCTLSLASLTQERLWSGTGTTRTSISFQPRDGRSVCTSNMCTALCSTCMKGKVRNVVHELRNEVTTAFEGHALKRSIVPVLMQIYDPTKKWTKYTIHGD